MTPDSTPIDTAPGVTNDERAAIAARTPPYDGVRTFGDLLVVRAQRAAAAKRRKDAAD